MCLIPDLCGIDPNIRLVTVCLIPDICVIDPNITLVSVSDTRAMCD